MAEKTFYKLKWRTVEGESQSKRFQAKNPPTIQNQADEPLSLGPALLRIEADGEFVATVKATNFIHLDSEDA